MNGYQANVDGESFVLSVWQVNDEPGWYAGVNELTVTRPDGKDEIFYSLESAKEAAEHLALEQIIFREFKPLIKASMQKLMSLHDLSAESAKELVKELVPSLINESFKPSKGKTE